MNVSKCAILWLLSYFLIAAIGCAPRNTIPAQGAAAICSCRLTNWSIFTPQNGGFAVLMPVPPKEETSTNQTTAGPLIYTSWIAEPSGVLAFSVFRYRCPNAKTSSGMIDKLPQISLGKDGTLISDEPIHLQGQPGREWKLRKLDGKALIVQRAYLVDSEVYYVLCIMPTARFCSKHATEFLDSFELKSGTKK
jgi:hypothetical protein